MKILFATDAYFTHNNGTSVSAQRFVAQLRKKGHQVRVMSDCPEEHLSDPDIYPLKRMSVPGFNHMIEKQGFSYAKIDERVMREAIAWADVVHMMMSFPMEWRCRALCEEMRKPMTTAFHVQMEHITSQFGLGKVEWLNRWLYQLNDRIFYSKIRHIHCPSRFMAEQLKGYGYQSDLRPISNGVSPRFVYRRPPEEKQFGNHFVILMVGRLSPEKRQDLIIEAVKKSRYAADIQLVFAGKGPLRERYERMCKGLPIAPVFGYYTQDELIDLMSETDLYIHASDMESEAIGCIEAFATGLVPVIADSRWSATPQFALCHESLFEAGNADSLRERIEWWYEHQDELPRWEKLYAESAKQYQLDESVRQFEQMLVDAIAYYSAQWGLQQAAKAI